MRFMRIRKPHCRDPGTPISNSNFYTHKYTEFKQNGSRVNTTNIIKVVRECFWVEICRL